MDLTPSLVWAARAAVSTSVATLRRLASSFSRSRLAAAACLASICARSSVMRAVSATQRGDEDDEREQGRRGQRGEHGGD